MTEWEITRLGSEGWIVKVEKERRRIKRYAERNKYIKKKNMKRR